MKKLGIIVLAMLMLTACGSKSDVDTVELINKALNSTQVSETNAFDINMNFTMTEGTNKMGMDMDGMIRQVGKFDLETIKKNDYSGIEIELTGSLDMAELGTKMDMSLYMQDGVFYINALGSKMKMDLRDMTKELEEALDGYDEESLTNEAGSIELTEEDLKDVKITKEKGFYRYLINADTIKKIADNESLQDKDVLEMLDKANLYIDINDDATVHGFGMDFTMEEDGVKMSFEFTILSMDIKDAKEIVFPKFDGYEDINSTNF